MRVLMADDDSAVRSALRLLLEHEPEIRVVGEARRAGDILTQLQASCPDLLLLDWELPGHRAARGRSLRTGLLQELRHVCPRLKVIVLSGRPEARHAAILAGADAFVSKGDAPERLLAAVRRCRCE
jgi:DNA-binding NarL/FixJ family response regulator